MNSSPWLSIQANDEIGAYYTSRPLRNKFVFQQKRFPRYLLKRDRKAGSSVPGKYSEPKTLWSARVTFTLLTPTKCLFTRVEIAFPFFIYVSPRFSFFVFSWLMFAAVATLLSFPDAARKLFSLLFLCSPSVFLPPPFCLTISLIVFGSSTCHKIPLPKETLPLLLMHRNICSLPPPFASSQVEFVPLLIRDSLS